MDIREFINKSEEDGVIVTTDLFWDCECKEKYMHPKNTLQCLRCGKEREESPDSRMSEILEALERVISDGYLFSL